MSIEICQPDSQPPKSSMKPRSPLVAPVGGRLQALASVMSPRPSAREPQCLLYDPSSRGTETLEVNAQESRHLSDQPWQKSPRDKSPMRDKSPNSLRQAKSPMREKSPMRSRASSIASSSCDSHRGPEEILSSDMSPKSRDRYDCSRMNFEWLPCQCCALHGWYCRRIRRGL